MSQRQYPTLSAGQDRPTRAISFVVVRFSDDYFHNILRSESVHDPLNELITIDNRQNLFFDNLGQAINAGIDRARHDLVVVVHEDVLLPAGWQQRFEASLVELEAFDPNWGLLGSAGWTAPDRLIGHWSDPHVYSNTFVARSFEAVRNIDEQLMILRRSSGLRFDEFLPSIHGIGRDLSSTLQQRGLSTYVVNAPTIHKYADETGELITTKEQSPKIMGRDLPSFAADWDCCEEYLGTKWPEWRSDACQEPDWDLGRFSETTQQQLESPVILLSRGGSGSRLISWLAQDAGVFLGNEVSISGDSMEMVRSLYMGILNKYRHRKPWQRDRTVPRIRLAAAEMLERSPGDSPLWGFKLPESILLLPELDEAFPQARYLHLIRDPLTTCLRRTHMTARFDNTIGRTAIREAYRYSHRNLTRSLDDSPAVHMAYTTLHQVEGARRHASDRLSNRYLEIRFEEVLESPVGVLETIGTWLGTRPSGTSTRDSVDPGRAARPSVRYSPQVETSVAEILAPLRQSLGYI